MKNLLCVHVFLDYGVREKPSDEDENIVFRQIKIPDKFKHVIVFISPQIKTLISPILRHSVVMEISKTKSYLKSLNGSSSINDAVSSRLFSL